MLNNLFKYLPYIIFMMIFENIRKWISVQLLKLSRLIYKENTNVDLVWLGYQSYLTNLLPLEHILTYPTNYIDSITIERLNYHAKAGTLTEKKFNNIKEAWKEFLIERPEGTYYIPGSGHYKLRLIPALNKLFEFNFEESMKILNPESSVSSPTSSPKSFEALLPVS